MLLYTYGNILRKNQVGSLEQRQVIGLNSYLFMGYNPCFNDISPHPTKSFKSKLGLRH